MVPFILKVPQLILIGSSALFIWAIYMWVRMRWGSCCVIQHGRLWHCRTEARGAVRPQQATSEDPSPDRSSTPHTSNA